MLGLVWWAEFETSAMFFQRRWMWVELSSWMGEEWRLRSKRGKENDRWLTLWADVTRADVGDGFICWSRLQYQTVKLSLCRDFSSSPLRPRWHWISHQGGSSFKGVMLVSRCEPDLRELMGKSDSRNPSHGNNKLQSSSPVWIIVCGCDDPPRAVPHPNKSLLCAAEILFSSEAQYMDSKMDFPTVGIVALRNSSCKTSPTCLPTMHQPGSGFKRRFA